MSRLDATFNIFPVTSHAIVDVFDCIFMSLSVLLDFCFCFFWAGFVVLGCLFYSVWFALFYNNYFHQSAFKIPRSCLILTPC